uniref:Uncharacterized protein n=1 Tax=Borrelia puertoricensis TaxID=2756107 RepID=A0AA51UMS8_9SPIR|nr:hypothetical protein MHINFGKF_00022 [Borrelia puertoricensis]
MYKYPELVNTDLNLKLPEINLLEEHDKNFFTDDYYKNLISSDKDIGFRLHKALLDYLSPQSVQEGDRFAKYRQIINTYWEFLKSIAENVLNLTIEQKVLLRFAALLPNALGSKLKSLISRTIWDNNYNEPFIYFDEWIYGVNELKLRKLATDESLLPITSPPGGAISILPHLASIGPTNKIEALTKSVKEESTSVFTTFKALILRISPSLNTSAPMSFKMLKITSTSLISGIFSKITSSSVSNVAVMQGKAAFLFPLAVIFPPILKPPSTR